MRAAAILIVVAASADAKIYSCLHSDGALHSQDSTDGCLGQICEYKGGVRICPDTEEEKQERDAKDKRDAECKAKRREGMLKDFGFLEKYPKRGDIEDKRVGELVRNTSDTTSLKQRRDAASDKLARLKIEAQFYGPKIPMPEELRADIDFYSKQVTKLQFDVSEAEDMPKKINRENDELLKRYDKLRKHEFEPVQCERN